MMKKGLKPFHTGVSAIFQHDISYHLAQDQLTIVVSLPFSNQADHPRQLYKPDQTMIFINETLYEFQTQDALLVSTFGTAFREVTLEYLDSCTRYGSFLGCPSISTSVNHGCHSSIYFLRSTGQCRHRLVLASQTDVQCRKLTDGSFMPFALQHELMEVTCLNGKHERELQGLHHYHPTKMPNFILRLQRKQLRHWFHCLGCLCGKECH